MQYQRYMDAYRAMMPRPASREAIHRAFDHLVISDHVLDRLGPAINSGHSMFVYGPPGNGKTVISQAIANLLEEEIAIPHALEVEGRSFASTIPSTTRSSGSNKTIESLTSADDKDHRWERCRRPLVIVGGELTLASLELTYNPSTGSYRAPVQALANGGVLVIDDFGRQACSPRDLLNRSIVPLESRVDFLTLAQRRNSSCRS